MEKQLHSIEFKNHFVTTFNGMDKITRTPKDTPGCLYTRAMPTPVSMPKLISYSMELGKVLGIGPKLDEKSIEILSGNKVVESMVPYAACYGGYQFGHWANQLGDGRAITLGEIVKDGQVFEVQLKGAGRTAYSRRGDGRAVLRSSVREYLMSEAMFYLGAPTTRALTLIDTGDLVLRDMFYDGNAENEIGAIVSRIAPSFLRFGNFQILYARGEEENLRKLFDWTVETHFPNISSYEDNRVIDFFKEVSKRTSRMITEWMRVGFVHGVMNTDNMSILGLTIDYGPFSFLDNFDPQFTPNTTDLPGRRYAFSNQPAIAFWNLQRFGESLMPLMKDQSKLEDEITNFRNYYEADYYNMMAMKFGLSELQSVDARGFLEEMEICLYELEIDMTLFYQYLIDVDRKEVSRELTLKYFKDCFYSDVTTSGERQFFNLIKIYKNLLEKDSLSEQQSIDIMRKTNPRFILRNYLLHEASEQLDNGDQTLFNELYEALMDPYSKKGDKFFTKRPEWAAKKAGCSMLSCSS